MTWNDPQLNAQTVIENACAASEAFYDFDMRLQINIPSPVYPVTVHDIRISSYPDSDLPPNEHGTVFYETTNEKGEYIYIYSTPFDAKAASGAPGKSLSDGHLQLLEFAREDNLDQWGEWEATASEFPTQDADAAAGPQAQTESSQSVPEFCGWQIEGFDIIRLVGEETLGEIKTHYYIAALYPDGSDGEEYATWEWWIDETGLLRRYRLSHYKPDGLYRIETQEFSGFGEPNIIVPPVTGTLHEAFLEIGADGLKPAGFTVEGTGATEIKELIWQNGTVSLTLDPHDSLTGYVLDFFAVDGTVSLSLDAATTTVACGKLTWPVASQPWQDGDHLMLRIRETGSTPILPP